MWRTDGDRRGLLEGQGSPHSGFSTHRALHTQGLLEVLGLYWLSERAECGGLMETGGGCRRARALHTQGSPHTGAAGGPRAILAQ